MFLLFLFNRLLPQSKLLHFIRKFLGIFYLGLDIGFIHSDQFPVQLLNFLFILDYFFIHSFDILLSEPKLLLALVLLLFKALLEKTKITGPLRINSFAGTLSTNWHCANSTSLHKNYQWCLLTFLCGLKGCLQMLHIYAFANYYWPLGFMPGTFSISGAFIILRSTWLNTNRLGHQNWFANNTFFQSLYISFVLIV